MSDYDVIIIGGGPAGLTAGLYLSRARIRTLLLEEESFGGKIKNLELIENYPGFSGGVAGAKLATEMQNQANEYGLALEIGKVTALEIYSGSKCVICSDGKSYTTTSLIIAGGSIPKKLDVPGEKEFAGKGVFTCAFCDGNHFLNQTVVVCGGGDAGITEALYMTKIAAIIGNSHVEAIEYSNVSSAKKTTIPASGILVHIGLVASTDYLQGVIPLDEKGQIIVNERMETEIPFILAAGDIRRGSPGQISTAVGDGTQTAISALKQLQSL
jgi:thioredoxin reductase (NADPH)